MAGTGPSYDVTCTSRRRRPESGVILVVLARHGGRAAAQILATWSNASSTGVSRPKMDTRTSSFWASEWISEIVAGMVSKGPSMTQADQHAAGHADAADDLLLAVLDLGRVLHRDLDLEDVLLHVLGLGARGQLGLHAVLVTGVGVDDVPVAGSGAQVPLELHQRILLRGLLGSGLRILGRLLGGLVPGTLCGL